MARLRLTFDIGPLATPAAVAHVFEDASRSVAVATAWSHADARARTSNAVEAFARGDSNQYELSRRDLELVQAYRELSNLRVEYRGAPPHVWFDEVWRFWSQRRGGRVDDIATINPFNAPGTFESFAPEAYARLVQRELARFTPPPVVVEEASYQNPLAITFEDFAVGASLLIGGGGLVAWLDIARGFSPLGRRVRAAQVREAEARADEAEASASIRSGEASERELRSSLLEQLAEGRDDDRPSAAALLDLIDSDPPILRLLERVSALDPEYELLASERDRQDRLQR